MSEHTKTIATNRRAFHEYSVEERFECGIVLMGSEIKSIRDGKISFPDAWAEIVDGEVWLRSFHVSENPYSSVFNHDPDRKKKLLLHREEIQKIRRKVEDPGSRLFPSPSISKKARS